MSAFYSLRAQFGELVYTLYESRHALSRWHMPLAVPSWSYRQLAMSSNSSSRCNRLDALSFSRFFSTPAINYPPNLAMASLLTQVTSYLPVWPISKDDLFQLASDEP